MLSVKVKFKPSVVQNKEGHLYYQIIYRRLVRQLPVSCRIFPEEWDCSAGKINLIASSKRFYYLASVQRNINSDIERIKSIYSSLISSSVPVTIDTVISEFLRQKSSKALFGYMGHIISQYWYQGKYRTSETYSTTLNSFRRFRAGVDVLLNDINSELLEAYEGFLKQNQLSSNTISFYMKHLRAVYNRALEEELITDKHPFRHVTTSIEKTTKRAVSLKVIRQLKAMDFSHSLSKSFARDMFLFSFYTRGMSFVDIAFLQKKNLKNNVLSYRRKKTNQQLTISWESCMHDILKAYSAEPSSPYLFAIIKDNTDNPRKQYHNVMCRINRSLKLIGKDLGLRYPLTLYCARHSWASIARDEGIPLSVISEGMGHDSEKTTQIYLASLKTEVIDKANRKILRLL